MTELIDDQIEISYPETIPLPEDRKINFHKSGEDSTLR